MKSAFLAMLMASLCLATAAAAKHADESADTKAAGGTTRPAQQAKAAATQPARADAKNPAPATQPTASVKRPSTRKLPTPGELLDQMRAMKAKKDAAPKVAYFNLARRISEKPLDFSIFGGEEVLTLNNLLERMRQAQADKAVRAVLLTLGDESPDFAQAQEIRDALLQLNKAGKQTFVYADSYDTAGYTLASGASHICMLEGGDIMLPGVGVQVMFARGLLDKIGVKADSIQIGEYKGADEAFTRTGPSDELKGELNKLTQSLYDEIVDGISLNRNLRPEQVRRSIDQAIIRGPMAKEHGLVDHLIDQDGLRDLIRSQTDEKDLSVVSDYGQAAREVPDFSNPFAMFAMMARRPAVSEKPAVAIVYASGMIVDGEGGTGLFGNAVGAQDFRRAMRTAARDKNIKAVVVRIDSPGGSALASEVMWQATRRVAATKPVVTSVGSMAASGGYYVASAGETIFADPAGIIGSIGVVGGKFVTRDLFEKLGLHTESFSRGRNANLFSSTEPFDERQRKLLTQWMRQTYDQFTERVMSTRKDRIKDIDKVARGRIFLARQAKELGLVDELGGTSDAVAYAAKKANLKPGEFEVRILPAPRTLADYFGFAGPEAAGAGPGGGGGGAGPEAAVGVRPGGGGGEAMIAPRLFLGALSPDLARLIGRQVQALQLLQQRPVMLLMPVSVEVR